MTACTCGERFESPKDLDDHIVECAHANDDVEHRPAR